MTNVLQLPKSPRAIISGVVGRDDTGKGRRYIRPSDELALDSVTHVLDYTNDQSFVKNWYSKLAGILVSTRLEEISALAKAKGPLAVDEFVKEQIKLLSEIKADIGSHQHHVLEALLLEEPIPEVPKHLVDVDVDGERVDHDAISDGILNFFCDFPEIVVLMAEATVANPVLGTAGTLDLVLEFPSGITIDEVTYFRIIVDLKAGKWLKSDMRVQLAAYRYSPEIWIDKFGNTVPMLEVDGAAVLHLRRDYERGYKLIIVEAGPEQHQWFEERVAMFKKSKSQPKRLGTVAYPPLPDGSQPLPLIEDIDIEGFGRCKKPFKKMGLRTIEDLSHFRKEDVLAIKDIGPKSVLACGVALAKYGLDFEMETN